MSETSIHLAILFADIAGSTRLYELFGNTVAQRVIAQALGILTDVVHKQEGIVVKLIGDEIMCRFNECEKASQAAVEMQRVLKEASRMNAFENQTINVRIGFSFGPVIESDSDIFGEAVNLAARVVAQAKAKEILTTKETSDLLGEMAKTRFVERMKLKGINEPLELHEILWEHENLTLVENDMRERTNDCQQLLVKFKGKNRSLNGDEPKVSMGRGEENDLVVLNGLASREHARIEFRGDRFVFVDQSINGSYVLVYGEREEFVRRDEFHLRGSGMISLGRSTGSDHDECIHFACMESEKENG
ncbi:MAG TPA: adenylate/guanylate cyclase domain-containing protein [Bacteroidota bacterium]